MYKTILRLSIFCVAVTLSVQAYAGLLITPLQVTMEGRTRVTEVVLVNGGSEANTYRLSWEQLDQVENAGGYVPVTEEERSTRLDLEDFAVFTPKQITLSPNSKQTIRIAVRRPSDLGDGEYKSHLKFSMIPTVSQSQAADKNVDDDEIGIGAKVYASYSIPVVYRAGNYDTKIDIGAPSFSKHPATSNIVVDLPISRSGQHGAIGLIELYHISEGGKEVKIGALGNANVFTDINTRKFSIVTQEKSLSRGSLRVVFKKAEGSVSDYTVLSEKTYQLGG